MINAQSFDRQWRSRVKLCEKRFRFENGNKILVVYIYTEGVDIYLPTYLPLRDLVRGKYKEGDGKVHA